jgi:hypothetical protein
MELTVVSRTTVKLLQASDERGFLIDFENIINGVLLQANNKNNEQFTLLKSFMIVNSKFIYNKNRVFLHKTMVKNWDTDTSLKC